MNVRFNELVKITLGSGANRSHVNDSLNIRAWLLFGVAVQPRQQLAFIQILHILAFGQVLPFTLMRDAVYDDHVIAALLIELPCDDRAYHASAASNYDHILF